MLDADLFKGRGARRRGGRSVCGRGCAVRTALGRKEYRTLEDYEAELKKIIAAHPGLARPVELPKKSFQGRPLMGVELSDNVDAKDDGKPTYFVMGTPPRT